MSTWPYRKKFGLMEFENKKKMDFVGRLQLGGCFPRSVLLPRTPRRKTTMF